MFSRVTRLAFFQVAAIAIVCAGFVQPASAGAIGTQQLIDSESRSATLTNMELLLAEEHVSEKLMAYGVDPVHVLDRMQNMTTAELMILERQIDQEVAGGSAIGVIGAVFLILLILELVGVTDIFKKI